MITALTTDNVNATSKEIMDLIRPMLEAKGLGLRTKGGSFNSSVATLKFEVYTKGTNGDETPEKTNFRNVAVNLGLQPTDLGREFTYGGHTYAVAGYRRGGRSNKRVLGTRAGRTFIFAAADVRRALGVVEDPSKFYFE